MSQPVYPPPQTDWAQRAPDAPAPDLLDIERRSRGSRDWLAAGRLAPAKEAPPCDPKPNAGPEIVAALALGAVLGAMAAVGLGWVATR